MNLAPFVNAYDRTRRPADVADTLFEPDDHQCFGRGKAPPAVETLVPEGRNRIRLKSYDVRPADLHLAATNAALVTRSARTEDYTILQYAIHAGHDAHDPDSLGRHAKTSGVPEDDARRRSGGANRSKVEREVQSGNGGGVQSMPAFLLKGERHEDGWNRDVPDKALEGTRA